MRVIEALAELIAPTRCAGCDLPGQLLCETCVELAAAVDRECSCPRCGAPFGALVCTECWNSVFAFERAIALGELGRPLARAVVLHKDAGERRLGTVLGELLAPSVAQKWAGWPDAVTWVPPTPAALTRRGFDHARKIAEPVAEACGAPLEGLLVRGRARDQRLLGRAQRVANAAQTFSAIGVVPRRVLVVDDVLTTGATLDAASSVLLEAGADVVRVAVIARSW